MHDLPESAFFGAWSVQRNDEVLRVSSWGRGNSHRTPYENRERVRLFLMIWKEPTCRTVPGNQQWMNVPNVNFDRDDRKVKLNANWSDNANDNWSVPVPRECLSKRTPRGVLLANGFEPPTNHLASLVQF